MSAISFGWAGLSHARRAELHAPQTDDQIARAKARAAAKQARKNARRLALRAAAVRRADEREAHRVAAMLRSAGVAV